MAWSMVNFHETVNYNDVRKDLVLQHTVLAAIAYFAKM